MRHLDYSVVGISGDVSFFTLATTQFSIVAPDLGVALFWKE